MLFATTIENLGRTLDEVINEEIKERGYPGALNMAKSGEFDFDFCLDADENLENGMLWYGVKYITDQFDGAGIVMVCGQYGGGIDALANIDRDCIEWGDAGYDFAVMLREAVDKSGYVTGKFSTEVYVDIETKKEN